MLTQFISVHVEAKPVQIVVGPDEFKFYVHQHVLECHGGSMFRAISNRDDWKADKDCTIKLPEEDPEMFRVYAEWLYTGKITAEVHFDDNHFDFYVWTTLAKLYIIGVKVEDTVFQDQVVDLIVHAMQRNAIRTKDCNGGKAPDAPTIELIYQHTVTHSPARRLLVDLYILHSNQAWIGSEIAEMNRDFVNDLCEELLVKLTGADPKPCKELERGIACAYHHHDGYNCERNNLVNDQVDGSEDYQRLYADGTSTQAWNDHDCEEYYARTPVKW